MRAIREGEGEGGGRKRDALEAIQNAAKDAIHQLVRKYLRRSDLPRTVVAAAIVDQVTS